MDDNLTDQQQAEIVKKWLKDNGMSILLSIALGISGYFGLQFYQKDKLRDYENASRLYAEIEFALRQQRITQAQNLLQEMDNNFSGSPYQYQSHLALAKLHMDSLDYDSAIIQLEFVMENTSDESFRHISRLRIARIMVEQKQLDEALGQIERQFGSGTVMRMGEKKLEQIPAVSTGSLGLDVALGIGGLPQGRVVEIYGPESSGKTTLTLEVIAQCQKQGGTAAFIDAEHALDPIYAQKLGVNVDELLISQPDTGEQALEVADIMVHSGGVDVLVIDSVAALVPKAEIEGEMGDSHVGLQARLMSQALRKLTGNVQKSNTLVIFINQIRHKIGVMFGSPETTSGGNALKFYSSVRLDIRRIGTVKDGDEVVGNETRVKVVKNKVSPPFKQAEFQIIYNKGINRLGELIDLACEKNVLEKSGAWYSYNGERIGQGKANSVTFLEENPKLAEKIEEEALKDKDSE